MDVELDVISYTMLHCFQGLREARCLINPLSFTQDVHDDGFGACQMPWVTVDEELMHATSGTQVVLRCPRP